ncbi:MAG: serine/threonine protein kinase [Actinomycetota bacterium]|nr:serine/threonine protein kinase [Actinomycetota bacterium]
MNRIADYSFIRPIGGPNQTRFYLAAPPARLGVDVEYVAVKVWSTAAGQQAVRQAVRELKHFAAAARVQSDYLVRLYDVGQEEEVFFLAMEYLPGGSLVALSDARGRAGALRAVSHACRAAHALHEAGIVHRNIKPSNILLHAGGAKLSDLGLTQIMAPGMTISGIGAIGSIEYLDPGIVARRERPSRASDIWSLGATLHRVLTGVGIYGELPEDDPLYAIRTALDEGPTLDASLQPSERAVIAACLAPDPADRPRTALAVAEAVENLGPVDPSKVGGV